MVKAPTARGLLLAAGLGLILLTASEATAQQANAWQINDNATITGVLEYLTNVTPAQVIAGRTNGWHYSLLSRIMPGTTGSPSAQGMAYGDGFHVYYIYFGFDSSGNLTAQILGSTNGTYVLPIPATDVLKYHLHEMFYDPATAQATYRCDGNVIASWLGQVSTSQSNQVMWGANSSLGRGEMNYHRAEFAINGLGPIATYDAGFAGSPATAPSPLTQGWVRFTGGMALTETPLSPDFEFIHPIAITASATGLHPGQATLNAALNPNGWPAYYWFDHGPTTGYGNSTPIMGAGAGTAYIAASALVTGLPRGVPYHFRVVASNSVGTVQGTDLSFTLPDTPPIASAPAGGGQPFDIRQPSLELNYLICTSGTYPGPDGGFVQPFIGEVRLFAGNFAPAGWLFCQGQLLDPNTNAALFSLLGTTYGGDGTTTFALPDLRSRTVVSPGTGPGLSPWTVGEFYGTAQVTWLLAQVPAHTHTLPAPYGSTGSTGGGQPRLNVQPALCISCLFALQGYFPFSTQAIYEPFLAQMPFFAGNFSGSGVTYPTGQLLPINQNQALYQVIGTNYGGDGQTTFGLPDLRSRTPMGNGHGPLTTWTLNQKPGAESVTMSVAQMPAHQHVVPWTPPLDFLTGGTGSNQPQSLLKPTLVLQYLIATNGEIPSLSTQATNKMIGEIQLFAGTNVPGGWSPCNGQLLPVSSYPALFGVISNFYGGDGVTTFALPNLSGRIPVGSVDDRPGASYGAEQAVLTVAQMPPHTHTVPGLDFDRWVTAFGLSGAEAAFDADADGDGAKNGFEYALGTNPTNSQSSVGLIITSGVDTVSIQFPRNTNAIDVNFWLERTTNVTVPTGWSAIVSNVAGAWTPPVMVTESGASNPVNARISDGRTNRPAADYRLKIQWP